MNRLTLLAAISLVVAVQPAAVAQSGEGSGNLSWRFETSSGTSDGPRLEFRRRGSQFSTEPSSLPEVIATLTRAVTGGSGVPIAFSIVREAGSLACTGATSADQSAEGTCDFKPSASFVAGLAQRRVELNDERDLLGLALVDARLVSIDIFSNAGLALADSDDLMTVSALHVTPAYRDELRAAGLAIDTIDDLVSARAVGVDGAWLSAMADAGYPARDAEQAIEMRALHITPDYARRMARAMARAEGIPQQ